MGYFPQMQRGLKTVLLVDDGPDERLLFTRAVGKAGVGYALQTTSNGMDALAYLEGEGDYADRNRFPLPELIILDINMPGMNGFEVLARVRLHPSLYFLPVVMFSTSSREEDVNKARELTANAYWVKPARPAGLLEIAKRIETFWSELDDDAAATPRVSAAGMPVS